MFVVKYNNETYIAKHNDAEYAIAFNKPVNVVLTISIDGSPVANSSVTINGTAHTTNSSGQITLTGNYGDSGRYEFSYDNDMYVATAHIVFGGGNYAIGLVLNTVTLTVTRYETRYQTLKTVYNGTTYDNDVTLEVIKGSSVRVYSGGNWSYTGNIIVNGVNSNKRDYTFTVTTDTTVTTDAPYDDSGGE